jgi:hypothetical protein
MELEDEADVTVAESGPGVAREQMKRFALNQQVPGIRRFQCAQQVQERAFASTGCPHNRHRIPGFRLKIKPLEDFEVTTLAVEIALVESGNVDLHPQDEEKSVNFLAYGITDAVSNAFLFWSSDMPEFFCLATALGRFILAFH